jgi:hypothetical protein
MHGPEAVAEPAPSPVDTPVDVPDAPEAPVTEQARATVAPKRAARTVPTAHAPADALEEARLVGALDAALRSGDGPRALSLADEHARRFPHGSLADEREAGRVLARCMTGARAASGADAFLAAHPRSPMRGRILATCRTAKDGAER